MNDTADNNKNNRSLADLIVRQMAANLIAISQHQPVTLHLENGTAEFAPSTRSAMAAAMHRATSDEKLDFMVWHDGKYIRPTLGQVMKPSTGEAA